MNNPASTKPSLVNLANQAQYFLDETTIIGRHEDCNMVLKSERGASRKHARITVENTAAVLMDLGSLNGTTVNGREISRPVQLSDGDIVVFDEQEYRFVSPNTTSTHAGDNVTVIANKDEIGRPDSIKPAIRVVETPAAPAAPAAHHLQNEDISSFDDTEAWEIPATSRPGGDAIKPMRKRRRSPWKNWAIIVPLLILLILIAFYFAYTTGYTAGTAGNPTRSS